MSEEVQVPSITMSLMGSQGIDPVSEPHWTAGAQRVFNVPRCDDCGYHRWPVTHACYNCMSTEWSWAAVPGTGKVFTYTWIDQPTHNTAELENIVVIELDGTTGEAVRVPGWVVDCDKGSLQCDLPVVADFDIVAEGVGVPYWRLA
jgi:uncharacterized protein